MLAVASFGISALPETAGGFLIAFSFDIDRGICRVSASGAVSYFVRTAVDSMPSMGEDPQPPNKPEIVREGAPNCLV